MTYIVKEINYRCLVPHLKLFEPNQRRNNSNPLISDYPPTHYTTPPLIIPQPLTLTLPPSPITHGFVHDVLTVDELPGRHGKEVPLVQEGELLSKVLRLDVVHSQLEGSLETGLVVR